MGCGVLAHSGSEEHASSHSQGKGKSGKAGMGRHGEKGDLRLWPGTVVNLDWLFTVRTARRAYTRFFYLTLRYQLRYHSAKQVIAGYAAGLAFGTVFFTLSEYIPLYLPTTPLGRLRKWAEHLWTGVGGIGGFELGSAPGGWGEGWAFAGDEGAVEVKSGKKGS